MLPIPTNPKKEERILICQAHRKKDGKPCSRLARKGEKYCWQHSPRFWTKVRKVATIIVGVLGSIAAAIILYTSAIKGTYDVKEIFFPSATFTPTQTSTATLTATSTFTSTTIPTSTPKEHGIYYMFVLDASLKMTESFESQTKWDAALRAVDSILVGLEDGANYGLVAIGGGPNIGSSNPCDEPSSVTVPFSTREVVGKRVGQLQPGGGGSLYKAFILAIKQFKDLPDNIIPTLIYITGSEDACESEDEWIDLERYLKIKEGARLNIYSEIIIIDDQNGIKTRKIAEQISSVSDKVNAQAPQTFFQLVQTNNIVINNVTNYVTVAINTQGFATATHSTTVAQIATTSVAAISTTTRPIASFTSTFTPTWTPSLTPSATPTLQPSVELLLPIDYRTTGIGCQVDVKVNIIGSTVTGNFHVRNDFFAPGTSDTYTQTSLPTGIYYAGTVDLNNLLTLGGDQPAYYQHEIWFEYNGGFESNHLTGVTCPGVP